MCFHKFPLKLWHSAFTPLPSGVTIVNCIRSICMRMGKEATLMLGLAYTQCTQKFFGKRMCLCYHN